MFMKLVTTALAAILLAAASGSVHADEYLGSYTARISGDDRQASDGYPLDTAAQMVRQDRANWHRFGRGDAEDEDDPWFASAPSRQRLERLLNQRGAMSSATRRAITRSNPVIRVDVYSSSVRVELVGR
jgi:hypothetical protein